jgi:hypothetical protein
MKNGNNAKPVSTQPKLYKIAPRGLYVEPELPKSLSQLCTGLYALEKSAQEENVKTQYRTITATPEMELTDFFKA